jgi:hypothetical protein
MGFLYINIFLYESLQRYAEKENGTTLFTKIKLFI